MAKRRSAIVLLVLGLAFLAPHGHGQFTAEEIARRDFWEKFLATAEIVRHEPLGAAVDPRRVARRGSLQQSVRSAATGMGRIHWQEGANAGFPSLVSSPSEIFGHFLQTIGQGFANLGPSQQSTRES